MHQLGHSIRGKKVIREEDAGPTLAEHIVFWPLDEEGNGVFELSSNHDEG